MHTHMCVYRMGMFGLGQWSVFQPFSLMSAGWSSRTLPNLPSRDGISDWRIRNRSSLSRNLNRTLWCRYGLIGRGRTVAFGCSGHYWRSGGGRSSWCSSWNGCQCTRCLSQSDQRLKVRWPRLFKAPNGVSFPRIGLHLA
jgi:hypothetical protein